jgi:hypothetical protein
MKGAHLLLIGSSAVLALALALRFAGLSGAFLVGAALALSLVISLIWASLDRLQTGDEMSFDDALHLATPTAAEEQKRAVLRTLKDLEYELSVGKVSDEDFASVSAQYRAEAKRLIAAADESLSLGRQRAEDLFAKAVASLPAEEPTALVEPVPNEGEEKS